MVGIDDKMGEELVVVGAATCGMGLPESVALRDAVVEARVRVTSRSAIMARGNDIVRRFA
jgi:hypothetical protein